MDIYGKMSSVLEKASEYMIGGFSLIPALAWNDLIRTVFGYITPFPTAEGLIFKVIYVLVISIFSWMLVKIIAGLFA